MALVIQAISLTLFPAVMAFAASSDFFTMTIANRVSLILVGGFGVLLVFGFDYKHKPQAWHHSLSLLKNEVLPRLKHLDADLGKAA